MPAEDKNLLVQNEKSVTHGRGGSKSFMFVFYQFHLPHTFHWAEAQAGQVEC